MCECEVDTGIDKIKVLLLWEKRDELASRAYNRGGMSRADNRGGMSRADNRGGMSRAYNRGGMR